MYTGWWLVGGIPTPLKNMTSPVGMMTFPIDGKNVPNHQPVYITYMETFNGTIRCWVEWDD